MEQSVCATSRPATCTRARATGTMDPVNQPIERRDVTTVMRLLADIQDDVRRIRRLLEEDEDGEEAASEDDA